MAANYIWLLVRIFIWMFDQARMRGKNVLIWPAPFSLAGRLRLTRRKVGDFRRELHENLIVDLCTYDELVPHALSAGAKFIEK